MRAIALIDETRHFHALAYEWQEILVGDADIPDVHAHAGAIETGIPNSRRIVIPDTGHLMYLEKPEELTRIVIDFLRAHWD
jgi:3-oxoadipate enol-lactonase